MQKALTDGILCDKIYIIRTIHQILGAEMSLAGKINSINRGNLPDPKIRSFTVDLQSAFYYYRYYYICNRWGATEFS